MKALYKYPHRAFPYDDLVREAARRTKEDPEYELLDTGIFADNAYFDVTVEYAKFAPEDIAIAITIVNRGSERRALYVLPTLWFRNTWSWEPRDKPLLTGEHSREGSQVIVARHPDLGERYLYCETGCELLFTENETNTERIFGTPNASPYVKDSIDAYIVHGRHDAVNPAQLGTKAAAAYCVTIDPGASVRVRLRLCEQRVDGDPFGGAFDQLIVRRAQEADEFYAVVNPYALAEERRHVQRQAFAGMLWCKQFYQYVVREWLEGDPLQPPPPERRWYGRNHNWQQLFSDDILSMPDNWEYPWFAAWDLAFHVIVLALIDPVLAKRQLLLLTREWYMHPNGQIPAYEWSFDDVNPPVQAWAALRIFQIEEKMTGRRDHVFLERVFQKLLMNFTWWVNRKDAEGSNVFQGGFLGLDNIGVFDRDAQLPTGGTIDQSDGTSWMGVYSLNMLAIAVVLAQSNVAYEDIASKFFEHFLYIAAAMNSIGDRGYGSVGRGGRFLLRRPATPRRHALPDEGPFGGRAHPAARRADRRHVGARDATRLRPPAALVRREPARPAREHLARRRSGGRRPADALDHLAGQTAPHTAADARRSGVPQPLRPALAFEVSRRSSVRARRSRHAVCRPLRACRIALRNVRRQLELARSDLVPAELHDHRGAAALPLLPR